MSDVAASISPNAASLAVANAPAAATAATAHTIVPNLPTTTLASAPTQLSAQHGAMSGSIIGQKSPQLWDWVWSFGTVAICTLAGLAMMRMTGDDPKGFIMDPEKLEMQGSDYVENPDDTELLNEFEMDKNGQIGNSDEDFFDIQRDQNRKSIDNRGQSNGNKTTGRLTRSQLDDVLDKLDDQENVIQRAVSKCFQEMTLQNSPVFLQELHSTTKTLSSDIQEIKELLRGNKNITFEKKSLTETSNEESKLFGDTATKVKMTSEMRSQRFATLATSWRTLMNTDGAKIKELKQSFATLYMYINNLLEGLKTSPIPIPRYKKLSVQNSTFQVNVTQRLSNYDQFLESIGFQKIGNYFEWSYKYFNPNEGTAHESEEVFEEAKKLLQECVDFLKEMKDYSVNANVPSNNNSELQTNATDDIIDQHQTDTIMNSESVVSSNNSNINTSTNTSSHSNSNVNGNGQVSATSPRTTIETPEDLSFNNIFSNVTNSIQKEESPVSK